tara:strand:+ start:17762 stop:18640 length:879 start_codon:yes stop_codon:yes gene_type:complete
MVQTTSKHGFAIVDKETGWTSHDVVAKARGIFGTKKIGHSGTLDPPASGVLILGLGKATRLLRFITDLPKEYEATMVIGAETSTLDADGEVLRRTNKRPSLEELQAISVNFIGVINQIPPMVSAVKVQGKRLYEIAREGKEITRQPRKVKIHELTVSDGPKSNVFKLKVKCGSGTYIRSLVSDIAQQAGSLGHVGTLRRTAIGSHNETEASQVEKAVIIKLTEGLKDYEMIQVDDTLRDRIKVGAVVKTEELSPAKPQGPWAIVDSEQNLLAMYENFKTGTLKPAVVLPQEN